MDFFRSEKISSAVTRIHGLSGELMYLYEGRERAALVDTGCGVGSLRTYVETLTEKPIIVLITHGHVDHVLGAPEFDEVYMNSDDNEISIKHSKISVRKGYLEDCVPGILKDINETDYIKDRKKDYKPLLPGDVFDLGGLTLEIREGGGHTWGTVTILCIEERTLLLGDACNYFTFLFSDYSLSVAAYEESMKILDSKTKGRYDKVYLSHGDGDAPKEMLYSIIQLCEDIKTDNVDDIPFKFMDFNAVIAKAVTPERLRIDGGLGNIIYNKDKIF